MTRETPTTPLRIVLLNETYSKRMGYSENCLAKAYAQQGHEVHLVTTTLAPYYYMPDFKQTYSEFNSADPNNPSTEIVDGYTVHYLPHEVKLGKVKIVGLLDKFRELKPDIVQTFAAISWIPLEAAIGSLTIGYKLFTGTAYTASVFPLAQRRAPLWDRARLHALLFRALPGRLISMISTKCYAATVDCADVAIRFFGVQKQKITIDPLGVELDYFHPNTNLEGGTAMRHRLGFKDDEIVVIYTGRFSEEKNPLLLAKAIDRLAREGERFRGLILGKGVQGDEIAKCQGCVLHPFVPFRELGDLFRASDIGCWPTQESTSMLDAAACGLPIVVNHTIAARERVDGNGITYQLNDLDDLVRALQSLRSPERRAELGSAGAKKMATQFGWPALAQGRLRDYRSALAQ